MQTRLDWSAYAHDSGNAFGSSFGDPFGDPFGSFGAAAASPPGGALGAAVAVCVGDRQCLRGDASEVMCPSYRVTGDPRQSPEGRVTALREALAAGDAADLATPALQAAMATCVGCKGCKRECPRGVDVAQMALEVRAATVAQDGLDRRGRLFARLPALLHRHPRLWRIAARLRNALPPLARLGQRWLGLAAGRSVPLPAARPFAGRGAALGDCEVVLFVDSFTRQFEPEIADAALEVLQAGGYRVAVVGGEDGRGAQPPDCGRNLLAAGLVEAAQAEAGRLLEVLAPALARGVPVVGVEPSCVSMLRDEFHSMALGPQAAVLSRHSLLLEEFLAQELDAGRLHLPLKAVGGPPALLHGHCHQKAFGAMEAVRRVLGLIPEFRFEEIRSSCCGMAGSFGLEAEHAALSLAMAEGALLPAVRRAPPRTTILADGFSCRHQIRDGSGRRAEHVAQLLRRALVRP